MATIRRFDDLGRISIPKTLREQVWGNPNMEGMQMDIIIQDDAVVIKKHKEADLVEVVRCKDCMFNVANMEEEPLDATDYLDIVCSYFMTDGMTADDYCSYGKKVE